MKMIKSFIKIEIVKIFSDLDNAKYTFLENK